MHMDPRVPSSLELWRAGKPGMTRSFFFFLIYLSWFRRICLPILEGGFELLFAFRFFVHYECAVGIASTGEKRFASSAGFFFYNVADEVRGARCPSVAKALAGREVRVFFTHHPWPLLRKEGNGCGFFWRFAICD